MLVKYSDIEVTPLKGDKYKTLKAITYKGFIIPKGFITNGASIPRLLWSFIPPNKSDILPAVIVHDYLCSIGLYEIADNAFESILRGLGVGEVSVIYLTTGVRVWHKVAYKKNNESRVWHSTYFKLRKVLNDV